MHNQFIINKYNNNIDTRIDVRSEVGWMQGWNRTSQNVFFTKPCNRSSFLINWKLWPDIQLRPKKNGCACNLPVPIFRCLLKKIFYLTNLFMTFSQLFGSSFANNVHNSTFGVQCQINSNININYISCA